MERHCSWLLYRLQLGHSRCVCMCEVHCYLHDAGGPKTAAGAGVMCGILLGVFEGVGVLMQRLMAENNKPVAPIIPETPPAAGNNNTASLS